MYVRVSSTMRTVYLDVLVRLLMHDQNLIQGGKAEKFLDGLHRIKKIAPLQYMII